MLSLYRALLRLYPASFRADYEHALLHTFEELTRHQGRWLGAVYAIADAVPNALLAHATILGHDLRYAARKLNRSRGFALTVVLVTALGVGANTATFSVADFVLFRSLPFPDAASLVRVCEGPKQGGGWGCMNEMSPANYRDVVARNTAFAGLGAFQVISLNLVGNGDPLRLTGALVEPQVMPLLGVTALRGKTFDSTGAADAALGTVVISYGLWQTFFGGSDAVVGTSVNLNGAPYVIAGVMPPGFYFPTRDVQVWLPLVLREADLVLRRNTYLHSVGRLKPGVSFEQARAELSMIASQLTREYPETNSDTGFSFFRQRDGMSPRYRLMLFALCGASFCLLLLTGANLASLYLVRGASREGELAIRAALGAGRERLVRQMLTESVCLALIGGMVGGIVAVWSLPLLASLIPNTLPIADQPRLDLRMLSIAGGFTLLTGIGFGLLPAMRASSPKGLDALREGARAGSGRRQTLRMTLVAIEVAMSVVLLVSSGLLVRAMLQVQQVHPGFNPDGVLTLRTALSSTRYPDSSRRNEYYRRVLTGVRALPGVESAAYTSGLPMVMTGGITNIALPGQEVRRDRTTNLASQRFVTGQFFTALGLPLSRGRNLQESDGSGRELVAVVSESFVRRHWPDQEPVGQRFVILEHERTVVGVVPDIKVRGLERQNEPQVYMPAWQSPDTLTDNYAPKDLLVRTRVSASALLPALREIIRQVDVEQPISDVRLLSDVVADQTETRGAQVRILGALAIIAILLTAVGIYGLLAFIVAQRAREIGVRLALGAAPGRIAGMIAAEGVRLALLGGIPGLLLAYGAARAMRALLFGVGPGDPITLGVGTALVLLVTVASALVPAIKAVRVDPLTAMRAQ